MKYLNILKYDQFYGIYKTKTRNIVAPVDVEKLNNIAKKIVWAHMFNCGTIWV